jgi:hypothetical protein
VPLAKTSYKPHSTNLYPDLVHQAHRYLQHCLVGISCYTLYISFSHIYFNFLPRNPITGARHMRVCLHPLVHHPHRYLQYCLVGISRYTPYISFSNLSHFYFNFPTRNPIMGARRARACPHHAYSLHLAILMSQRCFSDLAIKWCVPPRSGIWHPNNIFKIGNGADIDIAHLIIPPQGEAHNCTVKYCNSSPCSEWVFYNAALL